CRSGNLASVPAALYPVQMFVLGFVVGQDHLDWYSFFFVHTSDHHVLRFFAAISIVETVPPLTVVPSWPIDLQLL
ncbi:hypothetical protein L0F63_007225, partial [Massospora cicadina]